MPGPSGSQPSLLLREYGPPNARGMMPMTVRRHAVQRDRASNGVRRAAELALPELIAEHDDARAAGTIFVGGEGPPCQRRGAQDA